MTLRMPFDLQIPVLFVNPTVNEDSGLIQAVSLAGGLGIVDYVTARPPRFSVPPGVRYGVRIPFDQLQDWQDRKDVALIVIPLENGDSFASLEQAALASISVPVVAEVGNRQQAVAAQRAGARALIARGAEGPGWVSEICGFVLLQDILRVAEVPVFLRGGVAPRTASGAVAAGAAGVVLDVHLLLAREAVITPSLREFFLGMPFPATVTLAEVTGSPLRVYGRIGTRMVRDFRKREEELTPDQFPAYRKELIEALGTPLTAPDADPALLALSEDIGVAVRLAEKFDTVRSIVEQFERSMCQPKGPWPFAADSPLCQDHGTRFPIVQGPMAHVSDNPDFLAKVLEGGALPFLALANMPKPIAAKGLELAREKTHGRFGVGLIGLEVNRPVYEAHLELLAENPPPFAILAAGDVEKARAIERMGIRCYLHCPHPSLLSEGMKAGQRRYVFEGGESGGHVGTLGSLDLWNANLSELEKALNQGISPDEVAILFAGGIASSRAAAFIAGMVSDLASRGVKFGLQMGTAYLTTEEAVATCAITETYRKLTLESQSTVVIGRTVNTRARAAGSPMAARLIEREHERIRAGLSLRERKMLYEKDNLGSLRLAAKGCAIDPATATWDCPVFCDLPPEEQVDRGLYLMGQAVSLLERSTTVDALHREILENGREVYEKHARAVTSAHPPVQVQDVVPPEQVDLPKEPIAVVGIGVLFPGSHTPEAFWEQIRTGRSGIIDVPADRWNNPDYYYSRDRRVPDKTYSRIGGFITDFHFDPLKYRIPPSVARKMDRTQQMAVVCVGNAIADAGLSPETLKGKRVGIIIGNSMGGEITDRYAERVGLPRTLACLESALRRLNIAEQDRAVFLEEFRDAYLKDLPEITEDSLPGELANVISGRIANVFNLEGPNFTVDAACASSIAAVMNAVAALREHKIDYAISGGVDAAMHPSSFIKFCKIGALSPDGSRPFDEGANGFVMGEGTGMMVLKRLSDAVRDGDRIYATILEIGSSSDGRGKGITAPNASGQERAIRAAVEASGIDPRSVGLIEAHGTSTPVGDQTELMVLDRFFREAGVSPGAVGIGSVKSQIGHLKAAAGAAGMIKAILALYHKTLPPTINVTKPNPCIDWNTSPLYLLTEPRPWVVPNKGIRRAGVSAFGFGGTNFHVILQEHEPGLRIFQGKKKESPKAAMFRPPAWPAPPDMSTAGEAWVIGGANSADVLHKVEEILRDLTPNNWTVLAEKYRDVAATCEIRCGFSAANAEMVAAKLEIVRAALADPKKMVAFGTRGIHMTSKDQGRAGGGIAFLFPGQGSQCPYMLRDLAERFPLVAQTLAEADEILGSLGLPPVTADIFPSLETETPNEKDITTALKDTQRLQPVLLAANTAIYRLLTAMGVQPAACAGHSLGEYAACVAAGVFSFRDALEAVAVRGREMARVSIADPGLMMSIPADARLVEEVLAEVDGYVVAANKNSPRQTVISGETAAVKKAAELFRARGLEGVLLPVSAAFHSGVVAPAREPFMKTLNKLEVRSPIVPILSNVTGDFYPIGPAAPRHIRELLGKQFAAPVEWVKTLRRLYSDGVRIFLECGPKRVLTNLTLDTLPKDVLALPSNHPKKGGIMQFLETLAALAVEGVPVNFRGGSAAEEFSAPLEVQAPKPELKVVSHGRTKESAAHPEGTRTSIQLVPQPHALDRLLDEEIRQVAAQPEFSRYLEMQAEPIRAFIKSGYHSFVKHILPMERTVRQVQSEGMDFQPVVVSGIAAGLPVDVRFPFDKEALDDLILGRNFIKQVPEKLQSAMVEKNLERLVKGPSGEVQVCTVDDISGVIKLAGFFTHERIIDEYGIDERIVRAMDVTSRLAVAAGIEALKDAGIPLVRLTRTTTAGTELPDSWALPPAVRDETGVIFASAFPGMASLVDEVSRQTASRYGADAKKRLIEFYTGLIQRIEDDRERERITSWFAGEFSRLDPHESDELYTFNRDFLLKVMSMGHSQLAQLIKAQGPNTHVDAACAGTTQAIVMAREWIRSGLARRVIVIAADDVAGASLFPWIGSGFLSMGAATTESDYSEAALPFDERRHGLILGSAAIGIVVEREDAIRERGVEPIATIEAGIYANSAFHGTRLDIDHIVTVMEKLISKWERQSGRTRADLAKDMFFMSHETYSPRRGGSSAAEVRALRETFGEHAKLIPIANTKGFTGHTMGVGIEDVVALRCLQKQLLPPIPNLRNPDPEFADLNFSKGGPCRANYALRLAAGFGSQIVMALYKAVSHEENRIVDLATHRNWLKTVTGYTDPLITVEQRTLRVLERKVQPAVGLRVVETTSSRQASSLSPVVEEAPRSHVMPAPREERRSVSMSPDTVRERILNLLSQKTGYPPDMLDTGLDLEADLGIDTVKQAEFIAEVREAFGIPRIEGLKIADFPTIEHIIKFVIGHGSAPVAPGLDEPKADQKAAEGSVFPVPTAPASPGDADQAARIPSQPRAGRSDEATIQAKILELLSVKTGYPVDMLDPALDLEADLGIDTVKQAEFISEVRGLFNIPRIEGLKIADFPTIHHIVRFVRDQTQEAATTEQDVVVEPSSVSSSPVDHRDIGLFEARLVRLPQLPESPLPEADKVLIIGGPEELSLKLAEALVNLGYPEVQRVPDTPPLTGFASIRVGIVNLVGMEQDASRLPRTLQLYLTCANTWEKGPSFLLTVVSEDGAFGFECPASDAAVIGSLCGATKAFGREFPDTVTRVVDVHPELTPEQSAAGIVRSLARGFPMESAVAADQSHRAVRFVPIPQGIEEPDLRSGDVVLVTGGARGITRACLLALAQRQPLTIILFGRTELSDRAKVFAGFTPAQWEEEKRRIVERFKRSGKAPTPVMVDQELNRLRAEAEVFTTMRELRALGSEVMYRPVDVRDADTMDAAVRNVAEACGRVDVVIYAAGIDASKALRSKTVEGMQQLISVKIDGLENLLVSLERHGIPPRRVIGFGSVSGRFGNMAQVDYAAANDGLAHLLRRWGPELGARVSVIDWAPWSEIGMATRGSVQQTLEAAGIDFIPPEKGTNLLLTELGRSSGSSEVLAAGRLGPFETDAFTVPGVDYRETVSIAGLHGRVVTWIPGHYVKVLLSLDPKHPMLNDHRIDRAAVLPGVGGIELMRAVTKMLDSTAGESMIEHVAFRSPLKIFRDEPVEVELEAIRCEDSPTTGGRYAARILSQFVDRQGRRMGSLKLYHEGLLVSGTASEQPCVEFPLWSDIIRILKHDIYQVFFHGPAFQFLDEVQLPTDGERLRFRFSDTMERSVMFSDMVSAGVEAAFQAAAAYGIETRGLLFLPVAIARLEIWNPCAIPYDGELRPVFKTAGDSSTKRLVLSFDGILRDRLGQVIQRLTGVEMMERGSSEGFPARLVQSFVWGSRLLLDENDERPEGLKKYLNVEELKEFETKSVRKRREEWLAGRVALKRSGRRFFAEAHGRVPAFPEMHVVQDEWGKPVVHLHNGEEAPLNSVSLSHSNGLAVAVAAPLNVFTGIGVDAEKIEPRSDAWAQDYFTEAELRIAGAGPERHRILTSMWSLKEAALKALGTGLRFDLRDIEVSSLDEFGQATLLFHHDVAALLAQGPSGAIEARVEEQDGLVIATVLIRNKE